MNVHFLYALTSLSVQARHHRPGARSLPPSRSASGAAGTRVPPRPSSGLLPWKTANRQRRARMLHTDLVFPFPSIPPSKKQRARTAGRQCALNSPVGRDGSAPRGRLISIPVQYNGFRRADYSRAARALSCVSLTYLYVFPSRVLRIELSASPRESGADSNNDSNSNADNYDVQDPKML